MAVIKVKIYVPEIANVLSIFDSIRVQRSASGPPYTDALYITDVAEASAELLGTNGQPYADLMGRSLSLRVDGGSEQSVTFTLPNPISLESVIGQFNHEISGATMSDDGNGLPLISSDTSGTGSTLEITGGTGLDILGFVVGQVDSGEDVNVPLVTDVSEYVYDDRNGAASYWYRTCYYDSVSGDSSSWSDWMQGTAGSAIPSADLIVGYIRLADIDGSALIGARVSIVNVYNPYTKSGYFIAGRSVEIETDSTGCAEVTLIKGSVVDVILVGTSLIRRIEVPSTGTDFDLMDSTLVRDDPFQIQVPDLPAAPRSS